MIYICFYGQIEKIEGLKAFVKLFGDESSIWVQLNGNDSLELSIGDEGFFSGEIYNGQYLVSNINLRRLVDPLYQKDLLAEGALLSVIPLLNNPFPEVFKDYLKYENTKDKENIICLEKKLDLDSHSEIT